MAFRIASCKTLLKTLSGSAKAPATLKNIPMMHSRLLYKSAHPGLHYTQTRGIFWGEKKPKQDQDGTEKTAEEAQTTTEKNEEAKETKKKVESESEDEAQTKNTQNKTSQPEEDTKTQEEPAQQKAQSQKTAEAPKKAQKEQAAPETFDSLLENPAENKKKLHALYQKLEKELQDKARELKKSQNLYDVLEKATADHNKKFDELRKRLKEEVDERELMRKRTDKEVEQTKVFAITKFAKDLIEVPDNLGRALDAAKAQEGKGDPLYDGVKSTYNILLKVLGKHGVVQINPVNERFDPNYHEALFDFEDPKQRAGTCGFVANVGYLINERVLRPAKVGVVKGAYVETEAEKAEAKKAEAEKKN